MNICFTRLPMELQYTFHFLYFSILTHRGSEEIILFINKILDKPSVILIYSKFIEDNVNVQNNILKNLGDKIV